MLVSPSETLSEAVEVPQLKLHSLEIPAKFTGGSVVITKNQCLELRYFFSKSGDVQLNWREGIGGFYELHFQNERHDYWKPKAKMDQGGLAPGALVDLAAALSHIRGRFGADTNTFLYFFCPFVKVGVEDTRFALQINLNSNPVELKAKAVLDDEAWAANHGQARSPGKHSFADRARDIVAAVKGDGASAGVKARMEESAAKYFEVANQQITLGFEEKAADVKRVKRASNPRFRCSTRKAR